jgi:hypothetical protein
LIRARIFIILVLAQTDDISFIVTDELVSSVTDEIQLVSSVTDEINLVSPHDETNTSTFILPRLPHSFHSPRLVSDESYAVRTR